jgi:hypothetical protein
LDAALAADTVEPIEDDHSGGSAGDDDREPQDGNAPSEPPVPPEAPPPGPPDLAMWPSWAWAAPVHAATGHAHDGGDGAQAGNGGAAPVQAVSQRDDAPPWLQDMVDQVARCAPRATRVFSTGRSGCLTPCCPLRCSSIFARRDDASVPHRVAALVGLIRKHRALRAGSKPCRRRPGDRHRPGMKPMPRAALADLPPTEVPCARWQTACRRSAGRSPAGPRYSIGASCWSTSAGAQRHARASHLPPPVWLRA